MRRYFSLDLYIQCNPDQIAGELFYRYKQNGASFVAQMVKKNHLPCGFLGSTLGSEDPPESMATTQHPCLETPHGQRRMVGYSLWDCKELDTAEATKHT